MLYVSPKLELLAKNHDYVIVWDSDQRETTYFARESISQIVTNE
jgi:hypothetical protein